MTHQKTAAVLGCLMLTAVLPLTTAHLTSPSITSALASDGDDCRWEGAFLPCVGSSGVSGTYVTGIDSLFLTGGDVFPLSIGAVGTVFTPGYTSTTFVFCDLEVLDPAAGSPLNEKRVDGASNPPGMMDDGTWDDGGLNGACHTEASYTVSGWDTPGCGTGGTHAVAEDAVSGGDVWIGVHCDQATVISGSPPFTTCLVNAILSVNPGGVGGCLSTGQSDEDFIDLALLDPYGSGGAPSVTCGSDGIAEASNYGPGGGSGSAFGVPYPMSTLCTGGTSFVSAQNYVTAGGNPNHPTGGDPAVVPATAGWIDSRNLLSFSPAAFGPGLSVPGPTECSDLADNNGDGRTDASDPNCQTAIGSIPVYNPLDGTE